MPFIDGATIDTDIMVRLRSPGDPGPDDGNISGTIRLPLARLQVGVP